MLTPKIVAHPVMGWYVIAMLIVANGVIPLYFLVSPEAAKLWSSVGTIGVTCGLVISALVRHHNRNRNRV